VKEDGTKGCSCVPKCDGLKSWNIVKQECEPCGVNAYNAWYAEKNQGNITECRDCKGLKGASISWQLPATKMTCSHLNKDCKASCSCPSGFSEIKDGNVNICRADCDVGFKKVGTKCEKCAKTETSSPDRLKCIPCDPNKNPPFGERFFVSKGGCDVVGNICSTTQYYDDNIRDCLICPLNSRRDPKAIGRCLCSDGKTIVYAGMRCPSTCNKDQKLSTDRRQCIQCPAGEVRDQNNPFACIKIQTTACKKGQVIVKESGNDICRWRKGIEGCVDYYYGGAVKTIRFRTYPNCDTGWPFVKSAPNSEFPGYPEPYGTIKISCPSGYRYVHPGYGGNDYRNACCLRDDVSTSSEHYFIYQANDYSIDECCPKNTKPVGDICK
ncbi:MAG: hypothetical protein ABIE74_09250, partial [Pseudomonadota bacterium]